MILTYDDLVNNPICKPRVHGNGFLQLDLPEPDMRLHIWPEQKLATQKVYTGIHNHNFSFNSRILCGALTHIEYDGLQQSPIGLYQVYKTTPRDREDKGLVLASPYRYNLKYGRFFLLPQGSYYSFKYGNFHDSRGNGLTATIMRKTRVEPLTEVYVLCEQHEVPDNDFNRYQFKDEQLWPIVKQVFDKIKEIGTEYV